MSEVVVNITPPPPIALAYSQGGAVGPQGPVGATGATGPANKLVMGTVVSGVDAAATLSAQTVANGTATQTLSLVLPQGATGSQGVQGEVGPAGPANVLSVGSVETTSATTASVSITGTAPSQVISFVVPRGPQGLQGDAGPFTTIQVGTTSTGAAGSNAKIDTVTAGGTVTLNFTIPRGADATANLADETPQPLGAANAGTALNAARADHVHATLTSFPYGSLTGVPLTFAPSAHTHAVSDVTGLQTALDSKQPAGSYVTLVNGTVPSSMLPSFVDDVREAASLSAFPATGDAGVIYVAVDTKKIYRWSGSAYIEISPSPGTTTDVPEGTNLYYTDARAAAAAPVQSVAGQTGTVTLAQLGSSGTASSTTFLRGDGAWATAGGLGADDDIDGGWYYGTSGLSRSITVTSPPNNQTASGGAATFAVSAITEPSGTLSYQWQKSDASAFVATQRTLPASAGWRGVTYGNGTFVAVAIGGSIAATSTDGVTWTQRTLPASKDWVSVTYGNGTFVAVANGSAIAATSADGITWTQRTLPADLTWQDVTYGNGTFVAVASGYAVAATSTDGITWTQRTLPIATGWISVTYGNGTFVAVANNSTIAATSADGVTWTQRTLPVGANWYAVAYGNGTLVAVAYNSAIAATSADGIAWTQRAMPANANWHGIAFGGGEFFARTFNSTIAATSADGISWTQRTLPASASWYGLGFGSGTFVTVAAGSAIAATIQLATQSAFANVPGATSSTLALTGLTNAADNADRFRVVVSAANASSVTSQPATLTVS